MATAVSVSATNNAEIDGLLSGYKWAGTISYSFPDSPSDYSNPYSGGSSEPTASGFASAPTQMQAAINYAIGLILGYTNATIQYNGTGSADIMIAQSPSANPTSYAYYPGNYASGGDVWFGTQYNYSLAKLGNYYFTTALHELGHALGLKHSQEAGGPANVAVPAAHDDSEYTVMSYRSYVGGSTTSGYTNESYGYSQTYMANDILALQTMYGANYASQSGNTVYSWNATTGQEFINGVGQLAPGGGAGGSANRIYETVWDGGGVDTYDLSNYTTNLSINLNPGAPSVFSATQLANLGNGHYASGNVYNAYLYNGDARSYIDNAIGGSGNDTILGNAIANTLNGGSGNDTITGGGGNDSIIGGAGTDTAVYSGNQANYAILYNVNTQAFTIVDQRSSSPDGTDAVTGVEYLQFADGTIASSTFVSPIVIEALGTTRLVQVGNSYSLNPVSGGTGPQLKYSGESVVVDMWAGWAPIGAEQTGGGYDVAWKNASTGQYNVWSTDSNGNYVTNLLSFASAASSALESYEPLLHQDLNGDGVMGAPTIAIETAGTTSLVQAGNNYFLNPVAGGTGPELMFSGAPVTVGMWTGWAPIGAEQTGSGYDVAWKNASTGQYNIWSTDSNGHYVTNFLSFASGASTALQSYEPTFHQDLNGDGVIGVQSIAIERAGTTSLVQAGNNYFLNPFAGGTGPGLMFFGAPVTVGMWAGWAPVGAEQTGSGYNVAWKNASTGQYNIWSTDSNGHYVTNLLSFASGTSMALQSYETTFHQDLNGDGVIGVSSIAIESAGSTSLVQVGDNYLLNPVAGGTGPELMFFGAPITVGMWTGWAPIGAEQTGSGYDVAWQNVSTGQYNIWSTDSNGNYVTNLLSFVSGTSAALQSFETTFHQDLTSDGVVGMRAISDSGAGSTTALNASDSFVFSSAFAEFNNLEHVSSRGELLNIGSEAAGAPSFGPFKPVLDAMTHVDGNLAGLLDHLAKFAGHDLLP
ncbi:M10 family metallopeptidase C-terminal domain-containing protein [Bradyrhizobium sp. KB893862 SZCCT0404]|uniref:M10 family metallopeptidase C-terminal domain-containing protein n=1 Tax=Bradyrhizobium sp. KB893862 SZCCT0404 TaxID=2807672 RepID=UPI001BACADFF|nr:M10 family metallopeptidase C-terminal domain-containing protein [Bradyrhizobium sp. KB893862 SZCCT0404]MBR1174246.1 M10 family metallopeptidase C-terminal domain-containing protein [Bradyrhizobium sp. KB893862 SZCCT0404]